MDGFDGQGSSSDDTDHTMTPTAAEQFTMSTDDYHLLESNVVLSLVLVTIATLIIVINGLNMFVIAKMPSLHHATGILMTSLSAADFGVGVSVLLPFLHMLVSSKLSYPMCGIIGFINSTMLFVSIYNITFLSLDRCISIAKPLHYDNIVTPFRMKVVIATTWLLGCALWILPFIGVGQYKFNSTEVTCYFDVQSYPEHWVCYMAITFVPSSVTIATSYVIIWRIAREQQSNVQLPREVWSIRPQRLKANLTLVVIISAYYITWLPYIIEHFIITAANIHIVEWVEIFVYVLVVSNSLWNPLIYVGTNKTFRTAVSITLTTHCFRCKSNVVYPEGSISHLHDIVL